MRGVEFSWKWDMLKPLIRYADPMPVCIGDTYTQINYLFLMSSGRSFVNFSAPEAHMHTTLHLLEGFKSICQLNAAPPLIYYGCHFSFLYIEREEMTVDDLADTIGSSIGNPNRNSYVLRAILTDEDPRTIDIDIPDENKIIVNSHKYKLRAYLQKPVLPGTIKSSFTKENNELEICLRQK